MLPITAVYLASAALAVQVLASRDDISPMLTEGRRSADLSHHDTAPGLSLIPRQFSHCACYDSAFASGPCARCTTYSSGSCECPSYASNGACTTELSRCRVQASTLGQTCPSLSCDVAELSGGGGGGGFGGGSSSSLCPTGQKPCGASGNWCIYESYVCCGENLSGPLSCYSGQVCNNSDGTCRSSSGATSSVSSSPPGDSFGTSTTASAATVTTSTGTVRTTGTSSSAAKGVSGRNICLGFVGLAVLLQALP